jgi:hypothetical protein
VNDAASRAHTLAAIAQPFPPAIPAHMPGPPPNATSASVIANAREASFSLASMASAQIWRTLSCGESTTLPTPHHRRHVTIRCALGADFGNTAWHGRGRCEHRTHPGAGDAGIRGAAGRLDREATVSDFHHSRLDSHPPSIHRDNRRLLSPRHRHSRKLERHSNHTQDTRSRAHISPSTDHIHTLEVSFLQQSAVKP